MNADYIVIALANCLPAAQALKLLGARGTVAAVGGCFSGRTIDPNPQLFENWFAAVYTRNPLEGQGGDSTMDLFLTEYPKYAKLPTGDLAANVQVGWGGMMTLGAALNKMPAATLDSRPDLGKALKNFTGPTVLGPKTLDCNKPDPKYPSLCTLDNVYYQVKRGKFVEFKPQG